MSGIYASGDWGRRVIARNVVAPVDVLVGMGLLRPEHLNNWRRGRVPYLERVINCNLTRLSRLMRNLRFHAHDLNLKPFATVYNRYGKGPKQRLRFSKTGDGRPRGGLRHAFRMAGQAGVSLGADRADATDRGLVIVRVRRAPVRRHAAEVRRPSTRCRKGIGR